MITLTEKAQSQISKALTKRGAGLGIRIGVKTTGCSGLAYELSYADQILPEDHIQHHEAFALIVDPKSFPFVDEMTVDYKQQGLNAGFDFINSREVGRCGCGLSFRV